MLFPPLAAFDPPAAVVVGLVLYTTLACGKIQVN